MTSGGVELMQEEGLARTRELEFGPVQFTMFFLLDLVASELIVYCIECCVIK